MRYPLPGQRIGRAFLGRLISGPNPLGVPGGRVGRPFVGRLASGPNPLGVLGQRVGRAFVVRLARGAGPGPKVPSMPPFSFRGGRSSLVEKKEQGCPSYYRE